MRVIFTHDKTGTINTVAFLPKGAEDLELEPQEGESALTLDGADLPDRLDESETSGERLSEYGMKLREEYRVRDGRLVQSTR
jgi:hypothetical protein